MSDSYRHESEATKREGKKRDQEKAKLQKLDIFILFIWIHMETNLLLAAI